MHGGIEYRVYLDGNAAGRDFYQMVETITVEQALDMVSEARIELEMCANDKGVWSGPTEEHATPWRRMRIEVRNLTKEWVALIDGPVVAWNAAMASEPGRSTMTLVVVDDSIYLNIKAQVHKYEGKTDDEVVRDLLTKDLPFDVPDIDPFPARPKDRPLKIMRFCTQIDLLLELAWPYGRHVYVRPGKEIGQSVGCVKNFAPQREPRLPALVLTGAKRNIDSFNVRTDARTGAVHVGARLDVEKGTTKAAMSRWSDVTLLGDEDPFAAGNPPEKVEPIDPLDAALYDVQELAIARHLASSYVMVGQGSVRAGCYAGVLTAYDVVGVSGVDQRLCTTWLIKDVTHTLARSEYRQDFTVMSNAVATVDRDAKSQLPRPI